MKAAHLMFVALTCALAFGVAYKTKQMRYWGQFAGWAAIATAGCLQSVADGTVVLQALVFSSAAFGCVAIVLHEAFFFLKTEFALSLLVCAALAFAVGSIACLITAVVAEENVRIAFGISCALIQSFALGCSLLIVRTDPLPVEVRDWWIVLPIVASLLADVISSVFWAVGQSMRGAVLVGIAAMAVCSGRYLMRIVS